MTWVTLVESSFMSRMYVLDDEFQLSIALAQKALDDTVIPFQRHGRSCDPWVVGEACQEDHRPIHGWPSPWDVWEVPGFKSMTVRVDLNLSLSCSRLTTLLHLRLGCILMMITAVANDGLLRVHGMKEQLGFHCWKAHYEACVLNLLSTDILKPWLLRGSETALDLTSALNCGMPFWIRRCRRLSSCFVLHVGSDCQWLPVLHLTDSGGSGRKSRPMPTRFWPQRTWMMSLRLSLSLSLSFHFFKSNLHIIIYYLSAEFEFAQADLLINMYAPVAGKVCEIFPWFDRAQPLLSTLWEWWSSAAAAIHQWLWLTVTEFNSQCNAIFTEVWTQQGRCQCWSKDSFLKPMTLWRFEVLGWSLWLVVGGF